MDADRLTFIYQSLGDTAADRMLCEAMEELALGLARIGRARAAGDLAMVAALADTLERLGARIGLPKLRIVAISVSDCARRADMAALDATLARLSRVGNSSLSAVWDPRDQSI